MRETVVRHMFYGTLHNSTLIPATGFSLSEVIDATPSFILTEYGPDPWVLRGCYKVLKSSKKVGTYVKFLVCMRVRNAWEDGQQNHWADGRRETKQRATTGVLGALGGLRL